MCMSTVISVSTGRSAVTVAEPAPPVGIDHLTVVFTKHVTAETGGEGGSWDSVEDPLDRSIVPGIRQ